MLIRRALRPHNLMQIVVAPGLTVAFGVALAWGDVAGHPLRAGIGALLVLGGLWLPAMFLLSGALEADAAGLRGRIGRRRVAIGWGEVEDLRLLRSRRGQAQELMLALRRPDGGRPRRLWLPNWYEHDLPELDSLLAAEREAARPAGSADGAG